MEIQYRGARGNLNAFGDHIRPKLDFKNPVRQGQ